MAYVALYRQWRPHDFDNLIGQEHIGTTLKNAITSGKIAHAYLFSGLRGTGKTSTAKILAKALNCQNGPTPQPCNECSSCRQINSGSSMDVFEIDAASNRGIDEIRDLRETVKFAPADSRYKVYIIDEVHMLTTEAFNALLKTLEEPPAHVVFILATTEPQKIPATIHSRCQRYDFRRIGVRQIEERLKEVAEKNNVELTADALRLIAVKADGAMRDALGILDQCIAFDRQMIDAELVRKLLGLIGHELVWSIVDSALGEDAGGVLTKTDQLINHGKDVRQLLLEVALHMRSLMLYKAAPDIENIEMYSENKSVLKRQSSLVSHEEIVKILDILHEAINETKWSVEPRIQAEMALISICRRMRTPDLTALISRLDILESRMMSGGEKHFPAETAQPLTKTALPHAKLAEKQEAALQKNISQAPNAQLQNMPTKKQLPEKPLNTLLQTSRKNPAPPPLPAAGDDTDAADLSDANLIQVWETVLKEMLSSGKRSVHACIMQGHLVRLTDTLAQVEFAANFPKERTEKEDFRVIVENALSQITGKQMRLVCALAGKKADLPGGTAHRGELKEKIKYNDKLPEPQKAPKEDAEHPAVMKAREMFGGEIVKDNDY